jgi:hypothetical protein
MFQNEKNSGYFLDIGVTTQWESRESNGGPTFLHPATAILEINVFISKPPLLPVEKEDGILSLVEVCQPNPLQDGVVDIKVTLPIRRLCNSVQLVTFC